MPKQIEWPKVLISCKNNVKRQIAPLLKKLNQPQPNLGVGAGGDPIKQVDLAAEKALVDTLQEYELSFTLVSEESGIREYGDRPRECYVTTDPIDGTTNLTRGIPFYATSVAISTKPALETVHSALVTDLFHNITYTAQKGKGAYRGEKRITPSDTTSLREAVIGVDLNSYKARRIVSRLTNLIQETRHIRHFGANALELCYVADGTTDGFIDIRGKLRTTDMAAAWLIIQEAGAEITSPEGEPLKIRLHPQQKVEFVAAANHSLHQTILDTLKPKKERK